MADPAIAALNSLLRKTTIENHQEALKVSTAAIKAAKGSGSDLLLAQRTRAVALLKLDRFEDALRAIAEGGDSLVSSCVLEKAYALYKTGQLEEAEAALRAGGTTSTRGLRHVAAQIAYRGEKFVQASELYRELTSTNDGIEGEENDLRINIQATNAQLEWQGNGWAVPESQKQPSRAELEAFETAYNAACGCLARGDFAKAEFLLKRARSLCEASEDLSDEEKKVELLPIIIQQAYVATKLGKTDEAAGLQKDVDFSETPDSSTRTIAQSNISNTSSNPYAAQKLLKSVPAVTGSDRLFEFQSSVLKRNKYITELQAQKFDGVQRAAERGLPKDGPPSSETDKVQLGVLNAFGAAELSPDKEALRRILPLLETRPNDVGLLLTIIQLYIQLQNPAPALTLLEAFFKRLESATVPDYADVRYAPGLVALAVALYRLQGRQSAVRSELAKAVAHWQGTAASASGAADSLLREAGFELLHSSKPSDLAAAGRAFEDLSAKHPGDQAVAAGLVASFATSDFDKVEPHLEGLTSIEKLTAGIDVSALLDGGVATLPATLASAKAKKRALEDGAAETKPPPAKKPRKRRLPKDYEEGKKPDPERWLPLRDRSSYRPKGKKGKRRAAEATQGGVVREEETLELAGGAGSVKVEKAPAGGGPAGKKKKKGKK